MEYDEIRELTRYVWEYHAHLMSDFERRAGSAIFWRARAEIATGPVAGMIEKRWGQMEDRDIDNALAAGPEVFRQDVARRVLERHAGEVFINRCPACQRIVRTPQAKQCFWCGRDWH